LRDVAAQVNVMDKRDGRQAKKSVRKRESSFVSSLYSRIVHVRYSLLAACVCIFTLRCHVRAEPKNERDPRRRREKNGSPINGHDTAVNCLICADAMEKRKNDENSAQQKSFFLFWPPQLFLCKMSGFFLFPIGRLSRTTDAAMNGINCAAGPGRTCAPPPQRFFLIDCSVAKEKKRNKRKEGRSQPLKHFQKVK
jgi:hypothetical protein